MADFRLRVTAETQDAERKLRAVDKAAAEATKNRNIKVDVSSFQDINKRFKDISSSVKDAGNNIQTFYRFSKNIPGIGDRVREVEGLAKGTANLARTAPESAAALRENAKAGSILANSFESAGGAAGRLINNLAKAGFALFAVKEAVGVLQAAFGGFFNETIGREIKLRETILKTQTTLASTNKVFRNGKEITDPYEKIVALTGEVNKRIDSIRERSIALAGVTSNDVIEVFGIVASQVSQIGGGLKDAEDLAISFSAALGTFGLPLEQARQEIGSILRGDVGPDSILAKSLGIDNVSLAKAKTEAGGVIKFVQERLAASVAGQKIAAQGFSGVLSNIKDLAELVNQKFGAGLLDPLLGGLTKIFDFLFKIREEVFAIASGMGRGLGQLLSTNLTAIGGGSALFGQIGAGAEGFAASIAESVKKAFASLQRDANTIVAPLRNLFEEIAKSVGLVGAGLARLAEGFISIKIENFKALVQIFSNLSEAVTAFSAVLGQVLRAYGQLLQVPFVQYLSQISAQFQILEKIGVLSAVKLGFAAAGLIASWTPIVTFFQGLVTRIAALVGGLVIAVGAAFTRIGAIVATFAATLTATYPAVEAFKQQLLGLATSLTAAGVAADKAGVSVSRFGGATASAARLASNAILGFVKFNLILLAVQVGITVLIDLFGRWQKARDKAASDTRAEEALLRLNTTYKKVDESASEATKSAKAFEESLVSGKLVEARQRLEEVSKELKDIDALLAARKRTTVFDDFKKGAQEAYAEAQKLFNLIFGAKQDVKIVFGVDTRMFTDQGRREMLAEEQKRAQNEVNRWQRGQDKIAIQDNISLLADKRINLEKEINDLKKQQEDQIFQLRQQRAQKEVEIFQAAGELRIFQMEQANKKLIEGEEGASAAALEALNNYLSVRERGELDIESAKKSLTIEAANLQRQIEDYKLENAKKIAEIQKRAANYEKDVADHKRRVAGQSIPIGGATGLTQGNTGTSSTGPHFHVAGAASEAEARAIFAADIRRQLTTTDVPGSPRSGGRRHAGYDLAGPAGTPLNLAPGYSLTNFTRDPKGLGGNYATIAGPNNKSYKVMHLQDPGSAYKGPGSTAVAPQAPSFADVGAPAVEKYAAAVRSLSGAMERLRALQEALTNAKTAAAFDEIAKAAFPKINVEQYSDQLIEAQVTLKALAETAGDAYDPDALKISVDEITKRKIQEREISEILTKAEEQRKAGKLTEAELNKLKDSLKTKQAEYLQQLEKERKLRQQVLEITRQQQAVEDLRAATQKIGFDLQRSRVQGTAAMGDAYAGDDPALKRRAEAEALIAQKRIELEEKYGKNSAQAQEELRKFAASTRAAAGELAKIDKEVADFQKAMAMIREGAKTITDGFKGFVKSILTGGDIQESMVTMLESVADKFLNMALDAAFKPLEDMLAQNFKDFFGIEDPTQALQAENNAALTANTAALNSVAAALGGAGAAAGGAISIPVQPFPASEGDFGGGFGVDTTGEFDLPGLSGTGALKQSAQEAAAATTEQADANKKAAESAKGAGQGMAGLGQVLGSLAGIAGGAGAIAGGFGMMQKGGTYNTLMGLAGIFGGIGGIAGGFTGFFRASGGPVSANRPYIVGEKGPELFSPSGNGTITSNQALFSANRGAMGTGSAGGGDPFSENRSAISSSQAALERRTETERMQRATANPSPIDIRYEAQVINNVEYVTTDQFRSGLNQAAERGRALAYNGIQNSTKVRSRLGV